MMGSEAEVLHLPAARMRAPLTAYQLGSVVTPDEARRFVAIVSGDRTVMAALKCERRGFMSSDFVAKVVNGSDDEIACSVTGWTHHGSVSLEPGYFWIKPQSVVQIPIRAPLRLPHRLRTIALHLESTSLRATAEADVPPPPAIRLASALALAGSLLLAGLISWRSMLPSISAYTLPTEVAAGDRIDASYAYGGVGTAEYNVTSDGTQIAGGVLPARSGSFSFPTRRDAAAYHVTLAVVGPFGTVRRQLVARAVSISDSGAISIAALQPDPSVVRSGERVTVRYVADARSGSVTLFDTSGIALQRAPYSSNGETTLIAPSVDVPTQYRVELLAQSGARSARASAGLLVLPKDDAQAPPSISGVLTAGQVFRVAERVVSATTFGVRLLAHPRNLRLTFEDDAGTPVATQSVAPGESIAYFTAPNVSHDRSYVVVASFSRGDVEQALLAHVLVRVRGGTSAP